MFVFVLSLFGCCDWMGFTIDCFGCCIGSEFVGVYWCLIL